MTDKDATAAAIQEDPVRGMCVRSQDTMAWISMHATLAIRPGAPHDGQNADEPVSRPNNARRPVLVGSDVARMGSGTVRGDEPAGGIE
jgi:hypothetical protein